MQAGRASERARVEDSRHDTKGRTGLYKQSLAGRGEPLVARNRVRIVVRRLADDDGAVAGPVALEVERREAGEGGESRVSLGTLRGLRKGRIRGDRLVDDRVRPDREVTRCPVVLDVRLVSENEKGQRLGQIARGKGGSGWTDLVRLGLQPEQVLED